MVFVRLVYHSPILPRNVSARQMANEPDEQKKSSECAMLPRHLELFIGFIATTFKGLGRRPDGLPVIRRSCIPRASPAPTVSAVIAAVVPITWCVISAPTRTVIDRRVARHITRITAWVGRGTTVDGIRSRRLLRCRRLLCRCRCRRRFRCLILSNGPSRSCDHHDGDPRDHPKDCRSHRCSPFVLPWIPTMGRRLSPISADERGTSFSSISASERKLLFDRQFNRVIRIVGSRSRKERKILRFIRIFSVSLPNRA